MKKRWQIIMLIFVFIYILQFSFLSPQDSTGSQKRLFNEPIVTDEKGKELNPTKNEKKRLEKIDAALKNIQKKIEDPNSDINKKLFNCVTDALKNLFKPTAEGMEDLKKDEKLLKVTLSRVPHGNDTNNKHAQAAVRSKFGYHPKVNEGTYHGVIRGEIRVYPEAFEPENISCLEGNLFHEVLHMSCFTNSTNWLGEKIAYGCSHEIYPCASIKNPDDSNKDYKDECTEKNCKDEKNGRIGVGEEDSKAVYTADEADDNYSVADGVVKKNIIDTDFLIFMNGYYSYMDNLIGGVYFLGAESPEQLLKVSKTMVIPSGGLFGMENDTTLRTMLQEYVFSGGTLIVFAQQQGIHLDKVVPIPQNNSLKTYGWREDQSCLNGSLFFSNLHPILSGQTCQRVSAAVDGYFDVYPSNASVVLQRMSNRKPALLHYPFGNGTVILTTMFSDWACAHSQAPFSEKKIVRDMMTFAKAPNIPIPMVNLEENPTPTVNLDVTILNKSESVAAKVILKAYTPDRDRVLQEIQETITLNPGQENQLSISLSIPSIESNDYGICHIVYELFDESGYPLQLPIESESGRFALYKVSEPYQPASMCSVWVTTQKDFYYWDEQADLELHVRNYSDEPITMDWYYDWSHWGQYVLPPLTVPANSEINYPIKVDFPKRDLSGEFLDMFWVHYRTQENATYKMCLKGITIKYPRVTNSLITVSHDTIKIGDPITFTIQTTNGINKTLEDVGVKVYLEQRQWPDYVYTPVATVYDTAVDLSSYYTFIRTETYTPPEALPAGMYRLRLEITRPDGSQVTTSTNFSFIKSYIRVTVPPLETALGIPGFMEVNKSYPIRALIDNRNFFRRPGLNVTNGRCKLTVEAETGEEAFSGEVEGIQMPAGSSSEAALDFLFKPPAPGRYFFKATYQDETGTVIETRGDHFYTAKNYIRIYPNPGKKSYMFGETIHLEVEAKGSGQFKIITACEQEGFEEERIVTLSPENNNTVIEKFSVPTTFANSLGRYTWFTARMYSTDPGCEGGPGICDTGSRVSLSRPNIQIKNITGRFGEISARVGDPIDFNVNITDGTGFVVPLTGELKVTCMGYEDIKTVSIQPLGDNPFTYSIPVDGSVTAGTYSAVVSFKVDDRILFSKGFPIQIPAPGINLHDPGENLTAGETFILTVENPGGWTGNYNIDAYLKDEKGKKVLEYSDTLTINAGQKAEIPLTIPANVKSGRYIFCQNTKETTINEEIKRYSQHQVGGLSTTLDSYTLKDQYFDIETVSGKAEITSGGGAVENGVLNALIVKFEENNATSDPVELILEGADYRYNLTTDDQGRLWVGTAFGISVYNGSTWEHYNNLGDGSAIGPVGAICAGPGDKIYAAADSGIVVINGEDIDIIAHPPGISADSYVIGVDALSRIWVIYRGEGRELLYYDHGSWEGFYEWCESSTIISDRAGGIWLFDWDSLIHINADLSEEEFNSSNSGLPEEPIQSLYLDENNVLWLTVGEYYAPHWRLISFNGTLWTDCSSHEGYPANGMLMVTGGGEPIYGVGIDENWTAGIYQIEGDACLKMESEFYVDKYGYGRLPDLAAADGFCYTYGTIDGGEGNESTGILKIGSTSGGGGETIVWSRSYPVNIAPGAAYNIDLEPGITFLPGLYFLKAQLVSPIEQILAEDFYSFAVRGADVSVTLKGEPAYGLYAGKETDNILTVELYNNTAEYKDQLSLMVKKISPSGTETEISAQTVSLAPGQSDSQSIVFNESETGTWKIHSELLAGTDILSGSEMLLEVTEPVVSTEILSPGYAGDQSFEIKVKILNEGKMDVSVGCTIPETGTDETLTLRPGEEGIVKVSDSITADKTYIVTLSGDVEKVESKTVQYGYVEIFNVGILPSYREGTVAIGYDISNRGALPFESDLYFKLFLVGGTEALTTINRSYNLYPGVEAITETLPFELQPGNYVLKYKTSKSGENESLFTVNPAGIGTIVLSEPGKYPVGNNDIGFKITNSDTVAGNIELLIEVNNGTTPILGETRSYYLEPGEEKTDSIALEFPVKGNYSLSISGAKLTGLINRSLRVLNMNEIESILSVGTPEGSDIPVSISIDNTGYSDFTGSVILDVDGKLHEEQVTAASESLSDSTIAFDIGALTPGDKTIYVYLHDDTGELVAETTGTVKITGADIKISEIPVNLEISAGSHAPITLKMKNDGHLKGECILKLKVFDTVNDELEIALEPGQEIEIGEIFIDAPADLPTGNYPFNYSLSGTGVEGGLISGNFTFKVNGLSLDVDASLDRSLYNQGETAQLTLSLSSQAPSDAPLEVVVNWGNFSERRSFTLTSGSTFLVFDIPLDEERQEKIFYGIYFEGGKGIHLNDIYLRFRGEISVETDKQVYQPGEVISAVFLAQQSGTLSVQAFDESYTLPISSSASQTFSVPETAAGGTYGIAWTFVPADPTQAEASGSVPFDVAGLVVKVAKSQLEKGKYAPGETVNATYTFESNMDQSLAMRCWTTTPSGDWEYLGESPVSVTAERHAHAVSSYGFSTTQAGTHNLVYGLYRDDALVVSGSMAFDVGDAVLMGLSTDAFEYKEGNETVNVTAQYFGEGSAQLELFLDDVQVDVRGLTISGVGSTVIPLSADAVSGGSHILKAVVTKDGLTSTKTTTFLYGTNLPDLTVYLSDTSEDGLNYTFVVETANGGKTASAATSLSFSDNGTLVESLSVPALQPGESHTLTIQWSGRGKAGSHEFTFETDNTQTVKEFSENNNTLSFTRDVPVIFYTLEVEPVIWPANSDITIITRLINNQDSLTPVTLDLSITSDMTNETIFQRSHSEELPAFGSKSISDIFATGVYPAGDYTLAQSLSGANVSLHEQIMVIIETVKALEAVLSIQPETIPAGTSSDVELTMNFTNAGNVSLEEETVVIEVFNKESEEIVKSENIIVSVPIGRTVSETKVMALSLAEGTYTVRIKYLDGVITSADLTAAGGLEREKTIDIRPRVLLMNLNTPVKHGNDMAFLAALFQSQGISFESGGHILESFFKLHKGYSNVSVILGDMMGQNLRRELKERVWSGEGLIIMPDKAGNNPEWRDFLGVRVNTVPGKDRERDIRLLESDISLPNELREVRLLDKNKLSLIKLSDDVLVIAETAAKKQPVMTLRKYGSGYVLVSVLPLEIESGMEQVTQLFVNAVNVFSRDIYSACQLTRLLPVKLLLTNETGGEKTVTVKENLPYGVEGFDYVPAPVEDAEDDILKWNLTLGAGETVSVSYWLKLPDQVNTYDIVSEIYEGETRRDEVSISFEVGQTVMSRIDEMLLELETLDVSGADARAVRKAMNYLQQVRSGGENLLQMLRSLHFSVWTCDELSRVEHADVSTLRLRALEIVRILGRGVYDSIKQWGASRLTPFMQMIAVE